MGVATSFFKKNHATKKTRYIIGDQLEFGQYSGKEFFKIFQNDFCILNTLI